ncbi:homoserine kinase [Candidatus Acetothermia bacterium]|nr:homoserine kinase [Candidatus Acetothermia bacterium]
MARSKKSEWIEVFAPATVANCGPAFDTIGFSLDTLGDCLEARLVDKPGVHIAEITGTKGLSTDPTKNTAGIAAQETLKLAKSLSQGVEIRLHKQIPQGSGLGSSAASAVAGAYAVNILLGEPLSQEELLEPCLAAECAVSGYFADNVAPALLGGFVLIQNLKPLRLVRLPVPDKLIVTAVTPDYVLLTREARAVLPEKILLKQAVRQWANIGALVASLHQNDLKLLGEAMEDFIIEPVRAPLIPGFDRVKQAALAAGALGCAISGAGPTAFAITDDLTKAEKIAQRMQAGFAQVSLKSRAHIGRVSTQGARCLRGKNR